MGCSGGEDWASTLFKCYFCVLMGPVARGVLRGHGVGQRNGRGTVGTHRSQWVPEPASVPLLSHRCWDDYSSLYWWVIKAPILLAIFVSVFPVSPTPEPGVPHSLGTQPGAVQSLRSGFLGQVNFLIFLNVTRMLAQKIRCPDLSKTHKQQYM